MNDRIGFQFKPVDGRNAVIILLDDKEMGLVSDWHSREMFIYRFLGKEFESKYVTYDMYSDIDSREILPYRLNATAKGSLIAGKFGSILECIHAIALYCLDEYEVSYEDFSFYMNDKYNTMIEFQNYLVDNHKELCRR